MLESRGSARSASRARQNQADLDHTRPVSFGEPQQDRPGRPPPADRREQSHHASGAVSTAPEETLRPARTATAGATPASSSAAPGCSKEAGRARAGPGADAPRGLAGLRPRRACTGPDPDRARARTLQASPAGHQAAPRRLPAGLRRVERQLAEIQLPAQRGPAPGRRPLCPARPALSPAPCRAIQDLGIAQMYLSRSRERGGLPEDPGPGSPRNAYTLLDLADPVSTQGRREEAAPVYRQVVPARRTRRPPTGRSSRGTSPGRVASEGSGFRALWKPSRKYSASSPRENADGLCRRPRLRPARRPRHGGVRRRASPPSRGSHTQAVRPPLVSVPSFGPHLRRRAAGTLPLLISSPMVATDEDRD